MLPLDSVRRWSTWSSRPGHRTANVGRRLAWGQCLMFISMCYSLAHLVDWVSNNPDAAPDEFKLTGKGDQDVADHDRRPRHVAPELPHKRCWIRGDRHVRPSPRPCGSTSTPGARPIRWLGPGACSAATCCSAIRQDLVDQAVEAVVDHIPQHRGGGRAADGQLGRAALPVPSQITSLSLPFRFPQARATPSTPSGRG